MTQAFFTMPDSMNAPILADIDKIWIFIAIAIGSYIVEWLKKKKQLGDADSTSDEAQSHPSTTSTSSTTTTSQRPAPGRAASSDWEEELRRLLGGEPPVTKPPPVAKPEPAAAPPVRPVVVLAPRPVAAPPPMTGPRPVARTIPPPLAVTVRVEAEKKVEAQFPILKESVKAYQRASHLQERVTERLKHVEETIERHPAGVPTAHRATISADAVRTIALIRNRNTVRQAVIATLIFGAPKGLENE